MTIPDWLRPVFARVVASVIAAALGYLTRKGFDLGLSDAEVANLNEGIVAVSWGVMLAAYAAAHRLISIKTNPTDSASPAMAGAATGPLGSGERTTLGRKLDQAAQPVPPQPRIHDNIDIPRPGLGREAEAPPAYEPLMKSPLAPTPTGFGDTFEKPPAPKKKRVRKRPAQTPPEPGAPQPPVDPLEPEPGFEP